MRKKYKKFLEGNVQRLENTGGGVVMPPVIEKSKCKKCGYCAQICPLDVIKMTEMDGQKDIEVKYPDECWHCRACEKDCPEHAITMRYPLSHMMLHMEPQKTGGVE